MSTSVSFLHPDDDPAAADGRPQPAATENARFSPLPPLVASMDPKIVFRSLAAQCVPALCNDCTIEIVDGDGPRHSIVHPPRDTRTGGLLRLADRADEALANRVRIPFAHPALALVHADGREGDAPHDGFRGMVTFGWHHRVPTRSEHLAAAALVDRAVQTLLCRRSERATAAALASVAHLETALTTSRRIGAAIGILMIQHKLTQDGAFAVLRSESQHSQRKLRVVADEVVETGCLNSTFLPGHSEDRTR